MSTRPLAIVFDLDGTLIDSREDIVRAVQHTERVHGAEELSGDVIAGFVGDGARMLLARAWKVPESDPAVDGYLATFLEYYTAHAADYTTLMPGALEALNALATYPLAIATNKPRKTTEAVLTKLGLAPRFVAVVAGGDLAKHKPDAMVLTHLANELKIAPESLVMVGDGPQDIRAGHAVGARTVAVLGGFVDEAALRTHGADVLIASLADLPELIHRWSKE